MEKSEWCYYYIFLSDSRCASNAQIILKPPRRMGKGVGRDVSIIYLFLSSYKLQTCINTILIFQTSRCKLALLQLNVFTKTNQRHQHWASRKRLECWIWFNLCTRKQNYWCVWIKRRILGCTISSPIGGFFATTSFWRENHSNQRASTRSNQ